MQAEPSGELVDLGDGWTVPGGFTVTIDGYAGCTVKLRASYRSESGRYESDEVTVQRRGVEVTGDVLRYVHVAGILRQGAASVVLKPFEHLPAPDARALAAQGPAAETLYWVSRWYRLALLLGDPPTQRVASTLGIPRSTAGRWVTRARDRGLLTVQDPRGGRGE